MSQNKDFFITPKAPLVARIRKNRRTIPRLTANSSKDEMLAYYLKEAKRTIQICYQRMDEISELQRSENVSEEDKRELYQDMVRETDILLVARKCESMLEKGKIEKYLARKSNDFQYYDKYLRL
jgi:hypothetical protein